MKRKKIFSDNFRVVLYGALAILILLLIVYIQLEQSQTIPSEQNSFPDLTVAPPIVPASFAFPGAEGFGSTSPGGRYGHIIFVSNLNDTLDINSSKYVGSLRWALEHTWPVDPADPYSLRRIIIFKVGGTIPLAGDLILTNPFVTIAGQSAPGDGITLSNNGMIIATHDVVVRGIRIRVGDLGPPICCLDGINISTYYANSDVYNIVIDHSSVSWAIDENVSTWIDPEKPYTVRDVTVQWNIISEGLYNSIHLDEGATETDPHSMGAIFGQDGTNMTIHHNVFAHNWGRNPRISGITHSEVINNVMYGWDNAAVEISKDRNVTHVLNNYFRANSASRHQEIRIDPMPADGQVYIAGNLTYDARDSDGLIQSRVLMPENFELARDFLFTPSNVTMSSAEAAYTQVLNFAGAIYPVRDGIDQRVIDDVKNGTGNIIDSQSQVGGWLDNNLIISYAKDQDEDADGIPSDWEISHGLDPNNAQDASNPQMLSPTGYSWIEEYVNSLMPSLK